MQPLDKPHDPREGRPLVVVAGPTAGGKSAHALSLAKRSNGVIINADASQIYREIPILSAQPDEEAQRQVPHRLYGVVAGGRACSLAGWIRAATNAIEAAWTEGRLPILVGGTGLYLAGLLEGVAEIPAIPTEIRDPVRALGRAEVRAALEREDPVMAARLHPNDRQRNMRALEVVRATGRSLSLWQEETPGGLLPSVQLETILLLPDREVLSARCDARFDRMMADGALEEVAALSRMGIARDAPVMKALGVPPLLAALEGVMTVEEAVARAKTETRQYAKRQFTWFASGGQSRRRWLSAATILADAAL